VRGLPVWRSLPEPQMRAILVVVANILGEQAFQWRSSNCNDVIQRSRRQLPTNALRLHSAKDSRTRCRQDSRSGSNRCGDFQSVLASRSKMTNLVRPKWKRFSQLLDDPRLVGAL